MKRNCLLVGGSGFLGLHITQSLLRAGHKVTVLDRVPPAAGELKPKFIKGDYSNKTALVKALRGQDILFHLAWTTVPASPFDEIEQDTRANIAGSITLFKLAAEHGIKKIVFLSSGGTVYGEPARLPVPETAPTAPLSSYGIAKLAVEKYLYLFHHHCGIEYLILRIGNPYGPGQNPERRQGLIPKLLAHTIAGKPIYVFGGGKAVRDYIYVSDMASAVTSLIGCGIKNEIINIGSGKGQSVMSVIKAAAKLTGKKPILIQKPARDTDVKNNVLDIRKVKKLTRWQPVTSLDMGLTLTLEWLAGRDESGKPRRAHRHN